MQRTPDSKCAATNGRHHPSKRVVSRCLEHAGILLAILGILCVSDGIAQTNRTGIPQIPQGFKEIIRSLTSPSPSPTPVPRAAQVENDPRYAPLDRQLNQVYGALLARLSRAQKEQLRQLERTFIQEREALRANPDAYFEKTRQQIAVLQQTLDAASGIRSEGSPAAPSASPTTQQAGSEPSPNPSPLAPSSNQVVQPISEPSAQSPSSRTGNGGMSGTYIGEIPFGEQLKHVQLEVEVVQQQRDGGRLTAILQIPSENYSLRYSGTFEVQPRPNNIHLTLEQRAQSNLLPFYGGMDLWATYHEFDHEITFEGMNNGLYHAGKQWNFPPCKLVERQELTKRKKPGEASPSNNGGQPVAETIDPADITGVYVGTYITGQSLLNLELQVDRTPDQKSLDVIFVCYTPGGTAKEPLGSAQLKGNYDPQNRTLTLTAYQWSEMFGADSLSGLTGNFEPSAGKITGNLLPGKDVTFETVRDSARTAQRQADAKKVAKSYSEASTLIWDARSTDERCLSILKWVSRLDKEYPGIDFYRIPDVQAISKLINLFTDECFVPVFGKQYERMDKDDRERTTRMLRECWLDPNYRDQFTWHKSFLENPFVQEGGTNMSHALVAPAVAFRRLKRNHLTQVLHELEALPSTSDGFDRALSIQTAETNVKPEEIDLLWPSERHGLEEAVHSAKKRVAEGALKMRLDQALSAASDYEGIVKLQKIAAANSELFDLVPPAVRDAQKARVTDRIHAELTAEMPEEKEKIDGFGSGGQALKNGSLWYEYFSQKYLNIFHDSALDEVVAHFNQRRSSDLNSGEAEIIAALAKADSASEVKFCLNAYLGAPSDQHSEVGRRVQTAAETRLGDIAWEAEKLKYSQYEIERMLSKRGVIDVPAKIHPPVAREVALAVLRAFATHGEFIGPNTVKYIPLAFWKSLNYIIDIKQVELGEVDENHGAGFLCTYRIFFHMTIGAELERDAPPQATIMKNMLALMDTTEPDPIQTTLILTPSGWRSPEWDRAVSINSFDFFFKK